jgi:hypothetical protein
MLSKFENQLKFTVGALGCQAVTHPLHYDRGEVNAGNTAGDSPSKQLLPKPQVATPDLHDLCASANEVEFLHY